MPGVVDLLHFGQTPGGTPEMGRRDCGIVARMPAATPTLRDYREAASGGQYEETR